MGKLLLLGSVNTNSGSSSSALQFTNISGNYTDFLLIGSLRGTQNVNAISATLTINNITGANYNAQQIQSSGVSLNSSQITNASYSSFYITGGNATANAFSNTFIYVPNYTNTNQDRNYAIDSSAINSSSQTTASYYTGSWRMALNNDAITRIDLFVTAGQIAQYSTLYLYGINWTP